MLLSEKRVVVVDIEVIVSLFIFMEMFMIWPFILALRATAALANNLKLTL